MNSWHPAIANIKKKKSSTRIESLRRGMALMSEATMMRRPYMLETVRRGRMTRKDRSTERLPPLPLR